MTTRLLPAALAALGLALLAGPAAAQRFTPSEYPNHFTQVLQNQGRSWNDPVNTLNGPLFTDMARVADKVYSNLEIEVLDWPGNAILGVGPDSRCPYGSGEATRLVSFHNATGTYSRGQPIAEACTYLGQPKCSRTVTVSVPGHGNQTFTANRGSPPCPPNPQQAADNVPMGIPQSATGMFTVRIWGKVCYSANSSCRPAREPIPANGVGNINLNGYFATFKGGGDNCGPPIWPTQEMRDLGAPPYAAWCDFTFDIQ